MMKAGAAVLHSLALPPPPASVVYTRKYTHSVTRRLQASVCAEYAIGHAAVAIVNVCALQMIVSASESVYVDLVLQS